MHVGYVVEPHADEIAKALIDFFENNKLQEFTENILKEKERFSWDKMTNAISLLASQIKKKGKITIFKTTNPHLTKP